MKKEEYDDLLKNEILRANLEMKKLECFLKENEIEFNKIEDFSWMIDDEEFLENYITLRKHDTRQKSFYHMNGIKRNQIEINHPEGKLSIICHFGSFGYDEGLLELWDYEGEPIGHLKAEKALEIIKEKLKK
jgi:hypothetical protein